MKQSNHLENEKSLYLLQHATNPVDWYPWGDEAFEQARLENRPVFVSIGYSTCHWCHVMEHESFADDEVASMMNDSFISIKVDREERPDIDNLYMSVCQLMRQQCGWPLNVVMTPDRKPFFATTYVPKESRHQHVGMVDLIPRIAGLWSERREDIEQSAEEIIRILEHVDPSTDESDPISDSAWPDALRSLVGRFDSEYGGFGNAPKFPSAHNLLFLLREWKRRSEDDVLQMVTGTLDGMIRGGIRDHVGYGFHRYSTDRTWLLPHFEKMLYDQAMLLLAFSDAHVATGIRRYRKIAEEIGTYVLRDLTSPDGAFYSAEDADSEGVEGKFYIWSDGELRTRLAEEEVTFLHDHFGVRERGNFTEEAPTGQLEAMNILHLSPTCKITDDSVIAGVFWESLRAKLFAIREKRVHPLKDDKVLTDWNGLMIAALSRSSMIPGLHHHLDAALLAAQFVQDRLMTDDGRLLHRWRAGDAGIDGTSTDYAYLIFGMIELYQQTLDVKWLAEALRLNDMFIELFEDEVNGGFFITALDAEKLIVRQKDLYDGAIPSANSIQLSNLLRLSRITGNMTLESKAIALLQFAATRVNESPAAYTGLLSGMGPLIGSSIEVVVVGNGRSADTIAMLAAIRADYSPDLFILFKDLREDSTLLDRLAPFTASMEAIDGRTTAFVCRNHVCSLPTTDVEQLKEQIRAVSTT